MNPYPPEDLDVERPRPVTEEEAHADKINNLFLLDDQQFAVKSAKERDMILFLLLREMAGEIRCLSDTVKEYDEKIRAAITPEGIKEITDQLLEALGGGMLKGLL